MHIIPLPYPGNITAIPLDTILLLSISRHFVETGDTGDVLTFLKQLTASREAVFKCRYRLAVTFDGWTDDPRELYEIPEVVAYFRTLHSLWPYWAWFTAKGVEQVVVITALLSEAATVDRHGGQAALRLTPDTLRATQKSIFAGLLSLGTDFAIPPEALEVARDRWILELDQSSS